MPIHDQEAFEAFIDEAACAPLTRAMLARVLQDGPGTVIAYDLARHEYTVLPPATPSLCEEDRYVIAWGHGDLAADLPRQRDDGATAHYFAGALRECAFDYITDWYEKGPAAPWVADTRHALASMGFYPDRRSDRWDGGIRDHLVRRAQPCTRLSVKYTFPPGARRVRILLRLWDLGRQVCGAVLTAPERAVERTVTAHLADAQARYARRPEYRRRWP